MDEMLGQGALIERELDEQIITLCLHTLSLNIPDVKVFPFLILISFPTE